MELICDKPINLRNSPDPSDNAKASNSPIPTANNKAVDTEDNCFLSATPPEALASELSFRLPLSVQQQFNQI